MQRFKEKLNSKVGKGRGRGRGRGVCVDTYIGLIMYIFIVTGELILACMMYGSRIIYNMHVAKDGRGQV